MDNELLDLFTDRLQLDIPLIQEHVLYMQTDKDDATAKLFRIFHNYKASSSYLNLDEFHKLVSHGENILNSLRTTNDHPTHFDIQWLNSSAVQLKTWREQLLNNLELSPADKSLFPIISILDKQEKTADVMKGLTLLYVDKNTKRSAAMQAPLNHIFKRVSTTDSLNVLKSAVQNNSADVFILNLEEESIEVALELLNIKSDIALITAIPNLRANKKSRLLLKGLTHPIPSPIQSKDLKRQLHNIVTSHFSQVYSLISHDKIYNFIQKLDPLSSTMKKVISLCDDPDSSVKELILTINEDAIAAANILHAVASPIYGVAKTSSLNQAVAAFGKKLIKAISLSELAQNLGTLNLEAYEINEETFKRTSALRLALMDKWYSKVDPQALSILSASAILGNLGSILMNQELINAGLIDKFKAYGKDKLSEAEVSLLKTSTAFTTANVLEFWGLEPELIDAVRYSDSPFNANSSRVRALACANAVIYKMVSPYGELADEIPQEVKDLLHKAGLHEERLENALEQLKEQLKD